MARSVCKERARGALLGLFVGDAAGATLEFMPGSSITQEIARRAMQMPGGGIHRVGPGQVTDDSELAMALACALSGCDPQHGLPINAVAKQYRAWYESGPFDIGYTCSRAFGSSSSSSSASYVNNHEEDGDGVARKMTEAASRYSRGSEANGALMRITPVAIWLARQPAEQLVRAAKQDALLSHPNPVCQECNAAYALAMAHLLTHPAGDHSGAVLIAENYARQYMDTEAKQWLLLDSLDICHLDCSSMIGHVKHAFTLAFGFLRQNTSYEDAITLTLQKGGDTDTNAAIVGGLLGALHGADSIPTYMKEPVLSFDCTRTGVPRVRPRPSAYSTKHIEELLDGLLMRNSID